MCQGRSRNNITYGINTLYIGPVKLIDLDLSLFKGNSQLFKPKILKIRVLYQRPIKRFLPHVFPLLWVF